MKTIEVIATINANGQIQLSQPENLPIGKFKVVIVIDESTDPEALETTEVDNSFLSTAGDIIGSLQSLPADLSTNKQYFEGLVQGNQESNWDHLAKEIEQKSSLSQQQKLKKLLTSWLEEGDQNEQSETFKIMSEAEGSSI
jgi:hypothetical protein